MAAIGTTRTSGTVNFTFTLFAGSSFKEDPVPKEALCRPVFEEHCALFSTYFTGISVQAMDKINKTPGITGLLAERGEDAFKHLGLFIKETNEGFFLIKKGERFNGLSARACLDFRVNSYPAEDAVLLKGRMMVAYGWFDNKGLLNIINAGAKERHKKASKMTHTDMRYPFEVFNQGTLGPLYTHLIRRFHTRSFAAILRRLSRKS